MKELKSISSAPLPHLINDVHENESIGDDQERGVSYVTLQATEEWKRSRRVKLLKANEHIDNLKCCPLANQY